MKTIKFFLLLVIAVITTSFLTYLFYNFFVIEDIIALDMKLKVGANIGLNADTDCINFGKLMPGTSGERAIFMTNKASYPLRVAILKSGYIADWVDISENNFVLKKKERKKIVFEAFAPENFDFGNYTGKVQIIFKKLYSIE